MQPMKYPGHGVFGRSASYLDAEHGGRASTQILRASTVGTATDRGGRRQRFAHRRAARIGADQRRDEQATVPDAFWTRRSGSDTIKLLRSSVREHSASSRAAPQPAARSFFVPVIESKFVRKLIRRVQFASIVAANPWQGGAMYKLIKQPGAVDSVSLGGLAGSPLIERLKSSPLISTGNA